MSPLVRSGDVIHLRPLRGQQPHEGVAGLDPGLRVGCLVAVHADDGHLVVHRVVSMRDGVLLVRGDSNPCADGRFAEEQVLGIATKVERGGRAVWFGDGTLGPVIALAVRSGLVSRAVRALRAVRGGR